MLYGVQWGIAIILLLTTYFRGDECMKNYYLLYVNKDKYQLKIKKLREKNIHYSNAVSLLKDLPDGAKQYNRNYWFSCNRKFLKSLAYTFKQDWAKEHEDALSKIKDIKI